MTDKNGTTQSNIHIWLILIGTVIAILVFLFDRGILPRIWEGIESHRPPTFDFIYEGLLEPEIARYEVTQELFHIDSLLSNFQITVSADYYGNKYSGPVIIRILPTYGQPIEVARWDDFRAMHKDIRSFTLTPSQLIRYSGLSYSYPALPLFQNHLTEERMGKFDIEVFYDGQALGKESITVVNTPWTHSIQLSDSSIAVTEPITAFVTVKNFGAPSDFYVNGLLYEIRDVITQSLEVGDVGWWPDKSWEYTKEKIYWDIGELVTDQEISEELPLTSVSFNERRIYILETYVVKKLPDLKFPDSGDWISSDESWRIRDQPLYSTFVVLGP